MPKSYYVIIVHWLYALANFFTFFLRKMMSAMFVCNLMNYDKVYIYFLLFWCEGKQHIFYHHYAYNDILLRTVIDIFIMSL